MVDSKMLINKILERGYTFEYISNLINVNSDLLFMKIDSKVEFTVCEASKISLLLRLSYKEAKDIFFS